MSLTNKFIISTLSSLRSEPTFATSPHVGTLNTDQASVEGFGDEWERFSFEGRGADELDEIFDKYFSVFPWSALPDGAIGFDAGCGSGRWAERVAPRVGHLHCVDASPEALQVCRTKLQRLENVSFHTSSVSELPFDDASMDFGFSLGVLHHTPNVQQSLEGCVRALKPGAPFLLYLYYALDNRPLWFRTLWKLSDVVRGYVSSLPTPMRYGVSQVLAATVYWPLARGAGLVERLGVDPSGLPLTSYRNRSFYVMRNDALDRFGTRLEHRFTRDEIQQMMEKAGLAQVRFREDEPYWCAVGWKA